MNDRADEPAPTQALGHPMVRGGGDRASHHRPGFDERQVTTAEAVDAGTPGTAELPPSAPREVPRVSLSEQVRSRRGGGAAT